MAAIPAELELSPSKARLAATTSLAWTRITSWLTTLFWPAPVPPFEQNPATLAYLQQLMQANLAADQIRRLQAEVEREQLAVYEQQRQQSSSTSTSSPSPPSAIAAATATEETGQGDLDPVMSTLLADCLTAEARDALDSTAQTSVLLATSTTTSSTSSFPSPATSKGETSDSNPSTATATATAAQIGQAMHLLTRHVYVLENQVRELDAAAASAAPIPSTAQQRPRRLAQERAATQAAAAALANKLAGAQAEAELEQMRLRTAQWARETKQIGLKTDEYARRIAALAQHVGEEDVDGGSGGGGSSGGDVAGQIGLLRQRLARVESKRSEVRALEQRLGGFHGLPPDLDASRDEVKRAQLELGRWKSKREEMFEQL